jgi:hypothetical protein
MRSVLALLALLALPQDETQQVDNIYFRIPKGWKRFDQGTLRALVPAEVAQGRAVGIYLATGVEPAVPFREWFDKAWESVRKEQDVTKILQERDVEKVQVFGAGGLAKTATVELKNGLQLLVIFMGFDVKPRAESILFVSNDAEHLQEHVKGLTAFRDSMTFVCRGSEPTYSRVVWREDLLSPSFTWKEVPRRKGTAGLSGIFRAMLMEEARSGVKVRYTPRYYHWVFFPDGTCYSNLPEEGLHNLDLDYCRKRNPLWCGTYQMSGDTGTITIPSEDKPFIQTLRRIPEGLSIGGKGPYRLLDPCDGMILEGTYQREGWEPRRDLRGTLSFRKDGTFEEDGLLSATSMAWWRPRQYRAFQEAEAVPGKGRYRILENTLELLYEDGRKRRVNFALPMDVDREKAGAAIMINAEVCPRAR